MLPSGLRLRQKQKKCRTTRSDDRRADFILRPMNFLAVVGIGAVLGALDGVGIFFEPKEPYKWQILFAATLKGVLVALLTGFSLVATTRWWSAMVTGALYGLAFGLVIYLAKGDPKSGDAPYMIPSGITTFSVISVASYARE